MSQFQGITALPALRILALNLFEFDPEDNDFERLLALTASLEVLDLRFVRFRPVDYLQQAKNAGVAKPDAIDKAPGTFTHHI